MGASYPDPEMDEETNSVKGTTSTYPAEKSVDESVDESAEEQSDESTEEQSDESSEERVDEPRPEWRQLTVTLSASDVDTLPEMTISATHPTYSVSDLPVSDARCTLWVPEMVDALDFDLSFPETEQDDVSLTDIAVGDQKQNTITIPIVVLT